MTTPLALPDLRGPGARKALRWQYVTIAYNVVEGVLAVGAGLIAGSVALLGFGADSWVEVTAALLVVVRLRSAIRRGKLDERKERRALRFMAMTFFGLAAFLAAEGVREIVQDAKPEKSVLGIVLTGVSMLAMPWLAAVKRKAGEEMNLRLVVADAAETRLCAWMSASTFLGLLGYALVGWTWLDAVAGFVIAGFAVVEGRKAWTGELTCVD